MDHSGGVWKDATARVDTFLSLGELTFPVLMGLLALNAFKYSFKIVFFVLLLDICLKIPIMPVFKANPGPSLNRTISAPVCFRLFLLK